MSNTENTNDMKQYIDEAETALLHTYNRYQIVLDRHISTT